MAIDFMRIKKTLGGICVCSFDVQKPRATYQLPILYILYVWSLYKGDTEKQSLLYIGDTESES